MELANNEKWYLVQCKPRESFRAEAHLTNQGYLCFHPTHLIKRKVKGKISAVNAPFFPHYLFILLSPTSNWARIRSTRGVNRIVCFNGIPASLDHQLITALQAHCKKLNSGEAEPIFKPGQRVLINEGCFKELEAIVAATDGEERVILLINLFNRQQRVELPVQAVAVA